MAAAPGVAMEPPHVVAVSNLRYTVYPVALGNAGQLRVIRAGALCTAAESCTLATSEALYWAEADGVMSRQPNKSSPCIGNERERANIIEEEAGSRVKVEPHE